jgi:hypothetical protein
MCYLLHEGKHHIYIKNENSNTSNDNSPQSYTKMSRFRQQLGTIKAFTTEKLNWSLATITIQVLSNSVGLCAVINQPVFELSGGWG